VEEKKKKIMTPKFSALMSLVLGATLLVGAGCEDEAGKAALNTCSTSLQNAQKSSAAQTTAMNQLKADLAQAQAKVEELTKEKEQLKNPKMGKAETPAAKKPVAPAKKK
jgi:exonuclease VII small subunit